MGREVHTPAAPAHVESPVTRLHVSARAFGSKAAGGSQLGGLGWLLVAQSQGDLATLISVPRHKMASF